MISSAHIFLPDIIFEINEICFNKCLKLLRAYNYKFYFIDEINKKLVLVKKFSPTLNVSEGSNCYATCNALDPKIINSTV